MKLVFIGTPKFARIILKAMIDNNFAPVLVITAPDKLAGRKQALTPPEVKIEAEKSKIKVSQPEKIKEVEGELLAIEPDLIVLAAYGQIIPKNILNIPKLGAINIHPSLLPKYRGASPIQSAILNGDKKTGITIYFMDEKMDSGPIIIQEEREIQDKIFYADIEEELARLGSSLLIKTLPKILAEKISGADQNENEASYTKIIKKEDGHIDWGKPAASIERQIRAFSSWPGSFSLWGEKRIKILESEVMSLPNDQKYVIGKVVASPVKELLVACGSNFLIIKKLQIEGKKPISAGEFLKGHKDFIGAVLK